MLQIEEGKYYRARNGKKIGPMTRMPGADHYKWGWFDEDDQPYSHTDNGRYHVNEVSGLDLIAEWVDEAPAVDLTKIDKPLGLLDEATLKALKAHGGPYEAFATGGIWKPCEPNWCVYMTYRVRPQPPKPREFWINVYGISSLFLHKSREAADDIVMNGRIECIHVREVL